MEHEKSGKTLAKLVLRIPGAEEIDDTREEDSFGDTQHDTDSEQTVVVLHRGCRGADRAPYSSSTADV